MGYAIAAGSVVIVIVGMIGLWDLWRSRSSLETWQFSIWGIFIVILPLLGVIAWLLYRISKSEAIIAGFAEAGDTLEPPGDRRIRPTPPSKSP